MFPVPASDKPLVETPLHAWQLFAILLLATTIAFVSFALYRHTGPYFPTDWNRSVDGASLTTIRGGGEAVSGKGYTFKPQGVNDVAAASTPREFTAIDAKTIVSARIEVDGALPEGTLMFGWLTPQGRQRVIDVATAKRGLVTLDFTREPDWQGQVRGVSMVVRGELAGPLTIKRIHLNAPSLTETSRRIVAEWFEFESWHGGSINYVYGGHSSLKTPMPVFAALTALIAVLIYWGFCRGWAKQGNGWQLAALIIVPWLLLDLRWVSNLSRQLEVTSELFAGKTTLEKRRVDDADFFAFIEAAKSKIPVGSRVYMFSDEEYNRVKGGYLLRPLNTLNIPKDAALLPVDVYRPGEYLVLYKKRNVRYAPTQRKLFFGEGASLPAQLLVFGDGNGVFKVLTAEAAAAAASAPPTPASPAPDAPLFSAPQLPSGQTPTPSAATASKGVKAP